MDFTTRIFQYLWIDYKLNRTFGKKNIDKRQDSSTLFYLGRRGVK